MKLLEYKLPENVLKLKGALFYIYDTSDERVLAVEAIEYKDGDVAYGYKGQGFRQSATGWDVIFKFISIWDLMNYPKRYDYTKEWKRAILLAAKDMA